MVVIARSGRTTALPTLKRGVFDFRNDMLLPYGDMLLPDGRGSLGSDYILSPFRRVHMLHPPKHPNTALKVATGLCRIRGGKF